MRPGAVAGIVGVAGSCAAALAHAEPRISTTANRAFGFLPAWAWLAILLVGASTAAYAAIAARLVGHGRAVPGAGGQPPARTARAGRSRNGLQRSGSEE
jgi:hypothetical protein